MRVSSIGEKTSNNIRFVFIKSVKFRIKFTFTRHQKGNIIFAYAILRKITERAALVICVGKIKMINK